MGGHVCPLWAGYLLASPVRKLFQNPKKILGPHVKSGMKTMDIGCAMGFFSLPLAQMVGPNGEVICVDLQTGMINSLQKRAQKARLMDRIKTRVCTAESLGIEDLVQQIHFVLAFAVVHEVPNRSSFFRQICTVLKDGVRVLMAEPKGRVLPGDFQNSLLVAGENGLTVIDKPRISKSHGALLEKKWE